MTAQQALRRQKRLEKMYAPKVYEALNKQVLSFIGVVKKYGISYARRAEMETGPLKRVLSDLFKQVAKDSARITLSELRMQAKAVARMGVNEIWNEEVKAYLEKYLMEKSVTPVSRYTRQMMLTILQRAIDNGMTLEDAAKEIARMTELNTMRAMRIARTEVTSASNFGHMLGAYDSEYEYVKKWNQVNDLRTRATHRHGESVDPRTGRVVSGVGGEVVDFLKPFSNGLMYPGDLEPNKPEERINCRCVVTFRIKRDANGNPIRKPSPTSYDYTPRGISRGSLIQALLSGFSASIVAQAINELINSEQ